MKDQAFFAKYPVRIDDLLRPHALTGQKPYTVVAFVTLERIDYENFITDFTVERWFLKKTVPFCRAQNDNSLACVFVRQHGHRGGVLVVPDELGMVVWAAYLPNASLKSTTETSSREATRRIKANN